MTFVDMVRDPSYQELMVHRPACELLHGAPRREESDSGWVAPRRFLAPQERALGSCQAWHPGLYRQMSLTTAGVCVEFETDSSEIALELRPAAPFHQLVSLVSEVPGASDPGFDGVSCEVDGEPVACSWGVDLPPELQWTQEPPEEEAAEGGAEGAEGEEPEQAVKKPSSNMLPARLVCFSLAKEQSAPAEGVVPLPGFGADHHVRLWLPCLSEVEVREVWGDGTVISACDERPLLLVLGDGLAQGLAVGDPALTWASRLAAAWDFDLLNQGVVGQVFQPSSLAGLAALGNVGRIVIELGGSYRSERCNARQVSREVRGFLLEIARLWPDVPTVVVGPLPCAEGTDEVHPGSCFDQLMSMLAANVAVHDEMELVAGEDLLEGDGALFADGRELLGAEASAIIAELLSPADGAL